MKRFESSTFNHLYPTPWLPYTPEWAEYPNTPKCIRCGCYTDWEMRYVLVEGKEQQETRDCICDCE